MPRTPFLDRIRDRVLVGDGAIGTLLYMRGVPTDRSFDHLNVIQKGLVRRIHEEYLEAGAELLETNTFQANRIALRRFGLDDKVFEINYQGARLAKRVAGHRAYVAGSVGPLPRPAEGEEEPSREEKEEFFREQIAALAAGGVDLLSLETFLSLDDLLLALAVARREADVPTLCQMTFLDAEGTLAGVTLAREVQALEKAGADVIGHNCGKGFASALKISRGMAERTEKPVAAFPNAGLPTYAGGRMMYVTSRDYMVSVAEEMVAAGVNIVGGCCGTTPSDIRAIAARLSGRPVAKRTLLPPEERVPAEPKPPAPPEEHVSVLDKLGREPIVVVELDPPKNLAFKKVVNGARAMAELGVDLISMAENPLATIRMGNVAMARIVKEQAGIEPLVHFTCRDRNIIGLQADLMGACALGMRHVLAITGDPAGSGNHLGATSVYDVNSLGLIKILHGMNEGRTVTGNELKRSAGFSIGVAFNANVKRLKIQMDRLRRKADAGAHFALSQPVFDPERMREIYGGEHEAALPILPGIMPLLNVRNARFVHNEVPGMVLTEEVLARMEARPEGDEAKAEGLAIAKEMIDHAIEAGAPGFYVLPPFGNYRLAVELVRYIRERCGAGERA